MGNLKLHRKAYNTTIMATLDLECQLKINNKDIQIKFLLDLLNQNKIKIPVTIEDKKSLDELMLDSCALYNKLNRNTKIAYVEDNNSVILIEEEEDEEEEEENKKPRKKKIKKEEDERNVNEALFIEILESLKVSRVFKKILNEYNKLKMKTLAKINLKSYIDILLLHFSILMNICQEKKYTLNKTTEILSLAYSALDLRLLLLSGKEIPTGLSLDNIGTTCIDTDDINYLKASLSRTIYSGNDKEMIVNNFLNYGTVVMTLKQAIDLYLHDQKNICYLKEDNNDEDTFRFYFLKKETKKKRYWEMDCRLDEFLTLFEKNVSAFLIDVFRKIYFKVFHDYVYRENFTKSALIFESDCEQLLANLSALANYKKLSCLWKTAVKTLVITPDEKEDVFNLKSDDRFLKEELDKREGHIDMDMIKMLFDEISEDQAMSLYTLYNRK